MMSKNSNATEHRLPAGYGNPITGEVRWLQHASNPKPWRRPEDQEALEQAWREREKKLQQAMAEPVWGVDDEAALAEEEAGFAALEREALENEQLLFAQAQATDELSGDAPA